MTASVAILSEASLNRASCLWRAAWQGSIGFLAIWVICRLVPRMPARFQCWLWRLRAVEVPGCPALDGSHRPAAAPCCRKAARPDRAWLPRRRC